MKKHANIPIFIPHLGCPNQCVFCNQRSISGVSEFEAASVIPTIEAALSTIGNEREAEIAFFGGSFTGIDRALMTELLDIAYSYVLSGRVSGIRCSTRPDYIDAPVLDLLKSRGVKAVELGLQSVADDVLLECKRGHTAADAAAACRLIKEYGFELVGQMMIGLPGATPESEIETARFIIDSGASAARIYPTVVFRDTELADYTNLGIYTPLSVEDAVIRSAMVYRMLIEAGVEVIRIGLCASDNLIDEKTYLAGPNHPAIGELVESRIYHMGIREHLLAGDFKNKRITILVSRCSTSKAVGHGGINKRRLADEFGLLGITFREDKDLAGYEFKILQGMERECI